MRKQTQLILNQWQGMKRLFVPIGIAMLFLAALLWGLDGVTPVRADPGDLHVDGATGHDIPACGAADAPCQTLLYTLENQADDGDTILITAGTYTENLTIEAMTLTLQGGYTINDSLWITGTGETVFDGFDGDNYERVFTIVDSNVVFENLTITGGYANDFNGMGGGGIMVDNSSATIGNSTLISNTVYLADGGGLAAYNNSVVVLTDVEILNNQVEENSPWGYGGGLYFSEGTQATLNRIQVIGNTAIDGGGGLYLKDSGTAVVIHHSQIISNTATGEDGNSGGGFGVYQGSLNVNSSRIADNSVKDHGGAISTGQATVTMTNVLITGNQTQSGDANVLSIDDSDVTIINSTVANNNHPQAAQAILLWSGGLTITNSILSNNALSLQADPPCSSCFNINHSNIEGGWSSGDGNINSDPLFVAMDDYHLQGSSPCIDAGTNTAAPDHDLEQNPRPQDGDGDGIDTVDMGAYEFRLYQIFLPSSFKNFGP